MNGKQKAVDCLVFAVHGLFVNSMYAFPKASAGRAQEVADSLK